MLTDQASKTSELIDNLRTNGSKTQEKVKANGENIEVTRKELKVMDTV